MKDKRAVVTGSGRGLGKAFAVGLANAGVKVVVSSRTEAEVTKTVDEIRQKGGVAVACVEDVATREGAYRIIQSCIDNFGGIDILVNNAGITRDRTFLKMTEEEWDEVIAVHLKGTFYCTKFAVPYMCEAKWGRIINMTSAAGILGNFGQANYASAKAGILGFTRTLALELGRYNITVNAIRAAAITKISEPAMERARQVSRKSGKLAPSITEMGFYEPEIAAPLVVFLASDEAQKINGRTISIDGPRVIIWSNPQPVKTLWEPEGWTAELLAKRFKDIPEGELESLSLQDIVPVKLK